MKEKDVGKKERIFEEDELVLAPFNRAWTAETLLAQKGVFPLNDVAEVLSLDPASVKRKLKQVRDEGGDPYKIMGIRKVWSYWLVRMVMFAPYYREHLMPKTRRVDPEWDGNLLLASKGVFLLSDVAQKIPFNREQLRYQAMKHRRPREEMGVWKDEELGRFVVDMQIFASWLRRVWVR